MKRRLNSELVVQTRRGAHEQWIFLREPNHTALGPEKGIGHIEIEEIPEPNADSAAARQQVKETFNALDGLAGFPPEREPHMIFTKDCFDFEGQVRVWIYSDNPFA
jgi:hypothetical protein